MIAPNPTAAALAALATEYRHDVDDLQSRYASRASALLPETVPPAMSLLLLESIAAAASGEFKVAQALPAPTQKLTVAQEVPSQDLSDTQPLADKVAEVLGRNKARAATLLKQMQARGMYIGNTDNPAQAIRTVLATNPRFKRISRGLYCVKEYAPQEKGRKHGGGRPSAYMPMVVAFLAAFETGTVFHAADLEEAGVPRSSHYRLLKKLTEDGVVKRMPDGTWSLVQKPPSSEHT